jgi:antitoxin (DNA-binding transcriptional repressor) of toxin-antitoxin stability system
MKTIAAAEFKHECLALIDRVHENGELVTITERGRGRCAARLRRR